MKSFAFLFVVVALAASQCEAGLLKTFGKGTETLGSAINQGAIKAEDSLTSLFKGKKKEEEEAKPVVPVAKPAVPEVLKKDSGLPDVLGNMSGEKRPDLAGAPQIEIVYGKSVTTTQSSRLAASVITDNDDVDEPVKAKTALNKDDQGGRETIVGSARCAPGEVFYAESCRPQE